MFSLLFDILNLTKNHLVVLPDCKQVMKIFPGEPDDRFCDHPAAAETRLVPWHWK